MTLAQILKYKECVLFHTIHNKPDQTLSAKFYPFYSFLDPNIQSSATPFALIKAFIKLSEYAEKFVVFIDNSSEKQFFDTSFQTWAKARAAARKIMKKAKIKATISNQLYQLSSRDVM